MKIIANENIFSCEFDDLLLSKDAKSFCFDQTLGVIGNVGR